MKKLFAVATQFATKLSADNNPYHPGGMHQRSTGPGSPEEVEREQYQQDMKDQVRETQEDEALEQMNKQIMQGEMRDPQFWALINAQTNMAANALLDDEDSLYDEMGQLDANEESRQRMENRLLSIRNKLYDKIPIEDFALLIEAIQLSGQLGEWSGDFD